MIRRLALRIDVDDGTVVILVRIVALGIEILGSAPGLGRQRAIEETAAGVPGVLTVAAVIVVGVVWLVVLIPVVVLIVVVIVLFSIGRVVIVFVRLLSGFALSIAVVFPVVIAVSAVVPRPVIVDRTVVPAAIAILIPFPLVLAIVFASLVAISLPAAAIALAVI